MKYLSYVAIFFAAFTLSCSKSTSSADVPRCISETIAANENNADWEIGSVEEYTFQGQTVYAFNPDTRIIADGSTTVKSADCNKLCTIGGYGGPSINLCNGENFFQKATLVRRLWVKK